MFSSAYTAIALLFTDYCWKNGNITEYSWRIIYEKTETALDASKKCYMNRGRQISKFVIDEDINELLIWSPEQ